MRASISLDGILSFINSLSLSANNKRWLGERLIEEADNNDKLSITNELKFKDYGISDVVANMHNGITIPQNIDIDNIRLDYLEGKYK